MNTLHTSEPATCGDEAKAIHDKQQAFEEAVKNQKPENTQDNLEHNGCLDPEYVPDIFRFGVPDPDHQSTGATYEVIYDDYGNEKVIRRVETPKPETPAEDSRDHMMGNGKESI